MVSVAEIEDPEESHLDGALIDGSADRRVEASLAELWLTER